MVGHSKFVLAWQRLGKICSRVGILGVKFNSLTSKVRS